MSPLGEGPHARVLRARSAGSELALKVQKEVGPGPNPEVEARWQREHQALLQFGDEEPGLVGIQPVSGFEPRRGPPRFEPLVICQEKAALFHLPCPRCSRAHVLGDCRDDRILERSGLPAWSVSNERFLWCTACGRDDPVFYTNRPRREPGPVKDFVELVADLARVVRPEDGGESDPGVESDFPCRTCDQREACYAPAGSSEQGLATARLTPVSLNEFYAWPLPLCSLDYDEAADLLSGMPAADFRKRHRERWKTPAVARIKEAALTDDPPATPLAAFSAKLDLYTQAVLSAHRLHEMSGHPHLGLSPRHLLVQPRSGESPLVRLTSPEAPPLLDNLRLPPPDPLPPYAAPALLEGGVGRPFSVRVKIRRVYSGFGPPFFSAVVIGDELPAASVGENDPITLTLSGSGWEGTDLPCRWHSGETGEVEADALSLVSSPVDLTEKQIGELKAAVNGAALSGEVRIFRDFGIPCDVHALGVLLFRTFLANGSRSPDRVMEEVVLPGTSAIELLALNRPDAKPQDFSAAVRDVLGGTDDSHAASPRNVWYRPERVTGTGIPRETWLTLVEIGFRALVDARGYGFCDGGAADYRSRAGAPTKAMLEALREIRDRVDDALSGPREEDDEAVPTISPIEDDEPIVEIPTATPIAFDEAAPELIGRLEGLEGQIEEVARIRDRVWRSFYKSVVGLPDEEGPPVDPDDGRIALLSSAAHQTIECITNVFRAIAPFGGDELASDIPRIRVWLQDAVREIRSGEALAEEKEKRLRRRLNAFQVFLGSVLQLIMTAHSVSLEQGTRKLFAKMEERFLAEFGEKGKTPDAIRKQFEHFRTRLGDIQDRIFKPLFMEYVRDEIQKLKE